MQSWFSFCAGILRGSYPMWVMMAALGFLTVGRAEPVTAVNPAATPAFNAKAAPSVDGTAAMSGTEGSLGRLSPEARSAAEAGIAALGTDKFEAAETAFLELLKLSPDNLSALVNLGVVEHRLGKMAEAQGYLKRAIALKPDAALAWMTLGVTYMNQGDLEGATAALAQAVYLEPKNPQAHNYLAVVLARREWYDAAEDELQKVVELAPNFAEAHFNLALIYFERHPPAVELARRHYQRALELGEAPDADFEAKLNAAPVPTEVP
jgi:tetratricopeptide (TPR) repeat protein